MIRISSIQLFVRLTDEMNTLLAKLPGINGFYYRGWIFQRQQSGNVTATKADSIVSLED